MRRLLITLLLLCIPQLTCASGEERDRKHLAEINRLGDLIVQKNFEPITAQAEGKDFAEALTKVTAIVRDRISLKSLAPECKCLRNQNIIPPELCALIKAGEYTLTEVGTGNDRTVTLVVRIDQRQLKQLALFEMWPLFGHEFLKKPLT